MSDELKEAMFYEKLDGSSVRCHQCPHQCKINESMRGICGVRENRNGVLYSLVYGKAVVRGTDPIEKKPLFHFHPGSGAYSIATVGCNFRCKNCQNFNISQFQPTYKLTHLPPTPVTTLREAREIGLEVGLRYVYEGNVPGEDGESTYCYQCGALLIRRYGFQIMTNKISNSKCPHCGAMIDGLL